MFKRYYIIKSNVKFIYNNEYVKSFIYGLIDNFNNILGDYCYKYDNEFDCYINCFYNNILKVFENLGVYYEKDN